VRKNPVTVGLYEDSIRKAASIIDVMVREIKDITLNRESAARTS
jgi:hypothetical protein